MANEPWSEPGCAQYIGHPICEQIIREATSFSISDGAEEVDGVWTPESYFAVCRGQPLPANVDLSIVNVTPAGEAFVATVTLQRSFDDGANWHDVEQFTEPCQKFFEHGTASVKWRLGVKSGDYTSGDINLRLSQV